MANVGIECNGVFIGAMTIPGKKKPCFIVERGNQAIVLGSFRNDKAMEEFEKALKELLGKE